MARSKRTLLWVFTTNFGEGLPWSVLHQMAMLFLTGSGASKTQISSTSLLHAPGAFRFLWSPVVDLLGSRRRWVWVAELVLAFGMLALAVAVSKGQPLRVFWTVLAVISVLQATHDIACDGFYLQALDQQDQALFSGVKGAAFRVAMWIGRSVLVVLAGVTSWFWGFGVAAVLMLLTGLANAVAMPHPPDRHPQDPGRSGAPKMSTGAAFWGAYRSFLTQPHALLVLAFILVHRLGEIMMFAMASSMLRDIGISTTVQGVLGTFSMLGFMAGALIGGALIARFGLARCLVPMTIVQNFAMPLFIGLAVFKPGIKGVLPVLIVEQFASGIGNAANAVFLMQRCRKMFAASHFAFFASLVSLTSVLSGTLSGPLNEAVGNPMFFTIVFLLSFPGLVLAFFVPKTPLEAAAPATPQST